MFPSYQPLQKLRSTKKKIQLGIASSAGPLKWEASDKDTF